MIKCVILDFDGVVLESVGVKTEAFRELFSRYTDDPDRPLRYHLEHNGVSRYTKFKHIWENILNLPYDEEVKNRLGREFSEIVFEKVLKCPFVSGAENFLKTVSKHASIYVASATPEEELKRIVTGKGIAAYFKEICGTPRKKTDVIAEVLSKGRLQKNEVLYIGDSVEDWRAARDGGVLFIGRRNTEPLDNLNVPVFDDMEEICNLVLRGMDHDIEKELYISQYLKLINDLTDKYYSKFWFAANTASKNQYASQLFEDIFNMLHKPEKFKPISRNRFPFLKFFISSIARILRTWYRMAVAKTIFPSVVKDVSEGKDIYILRSGFYTSSLKSDGRYDEKFFGVLPDFLKKSGKAVVVIGSVYSGNYLKTLLALKKAKRDFCVIPQEYFVSWADPLRVILDILKYRVRIKESVYFMGHDVTALVKYYLNRDFATTAYEQILSFYITRNFILRFNTDTYIYFFENHAWQIISLGAVKEYSPKTRTIGYQHTIVSFSRLNLILGKDEKKYIPIPDRIVTNGSVTKDILMKYGNFPGERIDIGCALRFNINENDGRNMQKEKKKIKTILVALAALRQSSGLLDLAYDAFKNMPDYTIIIRPHPGFPLSEMRNNIRVPLSALPPNFSISADSRIEDDIKCADMMIYDESSLCFYSIFAGMPSIYVNTDPIINSDPLFDCRYLKRKADKPEDILSAIKYFDGLDPDEFSRQQELAKEYGRSYLKPVSEDCLKVFL